MRTNITNSSNDLCIKGHVGGLCESCDLFNVRKDGFYTK
jgi:hypothetical protein